MAEDLVSKLLELSRYDIELEGTISGAALKEVFNLNSEYIRTEDLMEVIIKYAKISKNE